MFLFQAVEATKVLDSAFGINPDKVFGVLVGVLICVIIAMGYWLVRQSNENKEIQHKLHELTTNAITVITNNVNVLNSLGDAIDNLKTATPAQILASEARMIEEIKRSSGDLGKVLIDLKK